MLKRMKLKHFLCCAKVLPPHDRLLSPTSHVAGVQGERRRFSAEET